MADGIIIHHSAGPDRVTRDWDGIRSYHVNKNKWLDIGYHFGIEQVAGRFQIMGGRPVHLPGAHAPGYNRFLGIVLIGNFDQDHPHPEAMALLLRLVLGLMTTYDLTPKKVRFHRDVAATACPGKNFPEREFLGKLIAGWVRINGGNHADD